MFFIVFCDYDNIRKTLLAKNPDEMHSGRKLSCDHVQTDEIDYPNNCCLPCRSRARSLPENKHFFSNRDIKKNKRRHLVNIPSIIFFK